MEQQQLQIWSDLAERIAFTGSLETTYHFFGLPDSNVIVDVQENDTHHSNLKHLARGQIYTTLDNLPPGEVNILISQSKELLKVIFQSEQVQLRRTCDINDIFKGYICLYTNLRNPSSIGQDFLISVQESSKGKLYLKYEGDQLLEIEQKKNNKKQSKEVQFTRLQSIFKDNRTKHKDIIDQIGKVTALRHPLLIEIEYLVTSEAQAPINGLGFYEESYSFEDQIFEWITYHKFDSKAEEALRLHLKSVQNREQKLQFSDQVAIPFSQRQSSTLFYKQKQTKRLRTYKQRFEQSVLQKEEKLMNIHSYLPPGKPLEGSRRYTVRGDYVFHHYLQDGFDDKGWGCAYRSFQTVLSWLVENGVTKQQNIPTHKEIQRILVEMDDKPRDFIGSSEWIGAFEVSMIINKLTGIDNRLLHIANGPDIVDKLDEFKNHFLTQGTPVMFGGGLYAYTLLGVEYNDEKQCKFLILDPHYVSSDTVKNAIEKGGISWKSLELFQPGIFYNFCMPQVN